MLHLILSGEQFSPNYRPKFVRPGRPSVGREFARVVSACTGSVR